MIKEYNPKRRFKELPLIRWYYKSTRNKIIALTIIFIIATSYALIYRPLGLIMWYKFNSQKELKLIRDDLNKVFNNREKFLELYQNFYEKQNIEERGEKIRKELLHYIDKLEIDLLATTFFGLDDLYLQAFAHKIELYEGILEWPFIYFISNYSKNSYLLTNVQTNNYLLFIKSFDKVLFFVNRLDNDSAKLKINIYVLRIVEILSEMGNKEICKDKDNLLKLIDRANTTLQTYKEKLSEVCDFMQYITNKTKENLNECK